MRSRRASGASASERQPLWARPDELEDNDNKDPNNKRHLGLFSTALLLTNRMIGAAIFSVPSSIFLSVGSVGAALSIWVVGIILTFCGFYIYLELGCLMPRTGGEKVYFDTAYPRPYRLASTLYAFYVLFGFPGLASIVVADNALLAFNIATNEAGQRLTAVGVMALVTACLSISREWSVRIVNSLTLLKLATFLLILATAFAIVVGVLPRNVDTGVDFRQPFAGSSTTVYDYTVSLFKVLESFLGWNSASMVLGEVKNPRKTLKVAGLLGVGAVGILYLLINVSYFIVATPDDISRAGVQLVARLLGNIFGSAASRVTAAMVALSTFGSMISTAFAVTRVIRELAVEGIVPAADILSKSSKSGNPATATSVFMFAPSVVAVLLLPFGDAYAFLLDVNQYLLVMVYGAVVVGLFIIRQYVPAADYPFRVWTWVPYLFLACQVFLLLSPLASSNGAGDTSLPFWLAPAVSFFVIGLGILYWRLKSFVASSGDEPFWTRRDNVESYGSVAAS
ncbi:amino acids transporter [Aspergillus nomiae NRRL 13137]|uniref:Amino acids transporter n=1 Tax=Aspergillus nomiae NRRL (strain ATCC 15546 / NRRL 13137 / CBS 260.88 / M93) TaxID=1509407 RepID=A0A0L1JEW2_ASPN3|nr:amino acids transporter [Aspergillus nomiae NRRL 13137]KNG89903.1 amino acids transporter [Aspergillus nomiae NRRL 13137]